MTPTKIFVTPFLTRTGTIALSLTAVFLVTFTLSGIAFAETTATPPAAAPTSAAKSGQKTLVNPLKVNSLEGLLGLIIDAAVQLGTIVLILALVYVGFLFVAARGSEEKIRDARRYFFWIVIGGLLVLGAKGLSEVIKSTANTLGT